MAANFDCLANETLARILAVANTSNYLYRHFRAEESIDTLSKQTSVSELFEYISDIANQPERTFAQTVNAYAALVALTRKPSADVDEWIANHGVPPLRWAAEILEFHKSAVGSISKIDLDWKQPISRMETGAIPAAAANTASKLASSPAVRENKVTSSTANSLIHVVTISGAEHD